MFPGCDWVPACAGMTASPRNECGVTNTYNVLKNFLWKSRIQPTPIVMQESARLNTGLKNWNVSPPFQGIQSGYVPFIIGK